MDQSGSPRVVSEHRDRVIDFLSSRYAHDDISETEFERRVEFANEAQTVNALVQVVVDLPESMPLINQITSSPAVRSAPSDAPAWHDGGHSWVTTTDGVQNSQTLLAFFSGSDMVGQWSVPEHLNSVAIFGGSRIDLREAEIPNGTFHIHAMSLFGGVEVIVPEGVNVVVRGFAMFGGFSRPRRVGRYPAGPTLVVDGLAFFGGVEVKVSDSKTRPRGRHHRWDDDDRDE